VADCLGAGSLVMAWGGDREFRGGGWLGLGTAMLLVLLCLFPLVTPALQTLAPYFMGLAVGTVLLFSLASWLAWRAGVGRSWAALLPFYGGAFFLLTNVNYPLADFYNHQLCLAAEFPHYFAGEMLWATLVVGLAWTARRFWPRFPLWLVDGVSLVIVAVAAIDLKITHMLGMRLEWEVIAFGDNPAIVWKMAKPYLVSAALSLALISAACLLAIRALHWAGRRGQRMQSTSPSWCGRNEVWSLAVTLVLLTVLGLAVTLPDKVEGQAGFTLLKTSPLWKRTFSRPLSREQFLASAGGLGMGDFSAASAPAPAPPAAAQPPLNVLFVLMESSYNQHLSLFSGTNETQPLLSRYRDRMELFPNFFSCFQGSVHAQFASFTSLYPARDFNAFTLHRVNVKSIFEVLHEQSYATSLFFSSFLDFNGFRDFLNHRGMDEAYDAENMPGIDPGRRISWGMPETETLASMRRQLRRYAAQHDRFFLTYIPVAPHQPFDDVPAEFCQFKRGAIGDFTPIYLNSLRYMDWVITSLVDELRDLGLLDQTLVVITNDHGEMLGANGGLIGHGWNLTPELANTPLIIMNPRHRGYRLNYTMGSQVDLLPTMLHLLGVPLPAGQLYEGCSLYSPAAAGQRRIYLNAFQRFAMIDHGLLFIGDRETENRSAQGCPPEVYAPVNEGSRTIFQRQAAPPALPVSIRQFDAFQENLLHNYALYAQAVHRKN